MKKLLIATSLLVASLSAEVISLLPYGAAINYDKDSDKSIKESSTVYGIHSTIGTLSYLLEFDYARFSTTYKQEETEEKLTQDDVTLAYANYFTHFMLRGGVHFIKTNDVFLGNGYTLFAKVGGYNYFGYDKLKYGLDGYYTKFYKGHDESDPDGLFKPVNIIQLSPYISFYKAFNINWGNTLVLRYNYQMAKEYTQENYSSFEVSDTIYYKQSFAALKAYGGEMRTGVKDGGLTLINTLDLMKSGYALNIGYTFAYTTTLTLGYEVNNFQEVGLSEDGSNAIASASLNYKF